MNDKEKAYSQLDAWIERHFNDEVDPRHYGAHLQQ